VTKRSWRLIRVKEKCMKTGFEEKDSVYIKLHFDWKQIINLYIYFYVWHFAEFVGA
jgi:hypothetical protein